MKIQVVTAIAMLAFAGASRAGTDNFVPNTGCTGTACTPYTNDNPALTVSYVNPYYSSTVILTLNGTVYRGPAVYTSTLISNPDPRHYNYLWHYSGNVLSDPIGNRIILDMDVYVSRALNVSGHPFWTVRYTVLNGTVTTP